LAIVYMGFVCLSCLLWVTWGKPFVLRRKGFWAASQWTKCSRDEVEVSSDKEQKLLETSKLHNQKDVLNFSP
jgi:hypothetical protein